jgi:hypothetical protein
MDGPVHIFKYAEVNDVPALRVDAIEQYQDIDWMGEMGKNGSFMEASALQWFEEHGVTGSIQVALHQFLAFARENFMFQDQDSVFMKLAIETATDEWVTPRLHQDGIYWDEELNSMDEDGMRRGQYKIGTVLHGPGTLFWDTSKVSNEQAKRANDIVNIEMTKKAEEKDDVKEADIRAWARDRLKELGVPVLSATSGECVRWIVGEDEKAAIHAEPDMRDMPNGRVL